MPKKSNNKMRTPCSGLPSELLMELMFLLQELKGRLLCLEDLESEIAQLSKFYQMISELAEESSENLEILLDDELLEELCRALESDKIIFMGIT